MRTRTGLIAMLVALLALAGCGGSKHHTPAPKVPTVPAPPLPANVVPQNCGSGNNHKLGQCLPRPRPGVRPSFQSSAANIYGCDLSNNDPVFGVGAWQRIRAHGTRFCYFKVNESTGFTDSTARAMTSAARAAGVDVGGYDFLHVCLVSPIAEADTFIRDAKADGLTGANTLAPVADTEYPPSTGCDTRAWIHAWRARVADSRFGLGRAPDVYTGEWWWGPHVGCWWDGGRGWISGYGVSFPAMPCGATLYIHQFTDAGFNGVSSGDFNAWKQPAAAYELDANRAPKPVERCLHKPYPQSRSCGMVRYGYGRTQADLAKVSSRLREHNCKRVRGTTWNPSYCRGWAVSQGRDKALLALFIKQYG